MKTRTLLILSLIIQFSLDSMAQDTKEIMVKSTVSEATVFINGAQVLRKKQVTLPAGKSIIKFVDLSPYIDAKSVQPKLTGNAMVMSVNYLTSIPTQKTEKLSAEKEEELDKKFEAVSKQLLIEMSNREVVQAELAFLEENKKIGGANTGVSLTSLRETANYYRERLIQLKGQNILLNKKIKDLDLEKRVLTNEINLTGTAPKEKPIPVGEVLIEVETTAATTVSIELSYYVKNASWYPSYDIRATSVDKPIDLLYKANIQQNTKEDWNNVKLKISSSDPNLGSVAPQLKTYFLDYYIAPPRYNADASSSQVTGIVLEESGEPLIGVNVNVVGTTIGTVTDIDGKFAITLPPNSRELNFTYVGFVSQRLGASNSFMTVRLREDQQSLDEIVVIGYGTQKKSSMMGSVSTVGNGKVAGISTTTAAKPAPREDIAMPTQLIENQTAVEFEIKVPYTIKSNNKNTTVEVDRYSLPADYEYYAIPKVNKDAFLLANISDWEKYNLLEGEANIFFENTYVGKTILDTRYVSDTLNISLGRDKSILINRESVKENTAKKFLSNNKEESRAWKINIRNNKSQKINFTLLDQVPVSRRDEIEVKTEETSGGSQNEETGEVKWKLILKPSEKKEINLRYKVKYPKSKNLTIE